MKYYYGQEGQEVYDDNFNDVINITIENLADNETAIIHEMKVDRKNGERWCYEYVSCIDNFDCGLICEKYNPRNGKNGICKNQTWTVTYTGRSWEVFPEGKVMKISSRRIKAGGIR